jgi:hypothetical protein
VLDDVVAPPDPRQPERIEAGDRVALRPARVVEADGFVRRGQFDLRERHPNVGPTTLDVDLAPGAHVVLPSPA